MSELWDIRMDMENLPLIEGDGVKIEEGAVIEQNIRHQLIEDGRINDLIHAPDTIRQRIIEDCARMIRLNPDIRPGSVKVQDSNGTVVFQATRINGTSLQISQGEYV